jgi:hypothetical protein
MYIVLYVYPHFYKLGHICYPASRQQKKRKGMTTRKKFQESATTPYPSTQNPLSKSQPKPLNQFLAVPLLNFPFNLPNPVSLLPIPKSILTAPLLSSLLFSTNS